MVHLQLLNLQLDITDIPRQLFFNLLDKRIDLDCYLLNVIDDVNHFECFVEDVYAWN